jgi:hypothetical protein
MEMFEESADMWRNPAGGLTFTALPGISRSPSKAAMTGAVYGSKVGVGEASFHIAALGQAIADASSTSKRAAISKTRRSFCLRYKEIMLIAVNLWIFASRAGKKLTEGRMLESKSDDALNLLNYQVISNAQMIQLSTHKCRLHEYILPKSQV